MRAPPPPPRAAPSIFFFAGDANKFPSTFPRVAQAINYTDANYQPGIAGALASYSLYRPTANNCTYTLDACLGVTTGAASDICNNPAPGVNPTLDVWYPHAVEDRDTYQYVSPATGTVSNTASWAPCGTGVTRLMTNAARQWALTVGGGHFWGGTSGTTANGAGSLPLYPLTGSIYSIAVYRRALSAAERSAVQAFLSARYELACAALAPPGVVGGTAPAGAPPG